MKKKTNNTEPGKKTIKLGKKTILNLSPTNTTKRKTIDAKAISPGNCTNNIIHLAREKY